MKGRDRNAPCWCGSGKKLKKCHLGREQQSKDSPWVAIDANRKAFCQKKCLAHDVGLGPCEGGIIKAHTVSRGCNLSKIAKDSRVLQYDADIKKLSKNGGKLSLKEVGIRQASVFNGFCKKHDQELFSCIENDTFTARPDQCLAVAYRTLSRELYNKDAQSHQRETLRGIDKGTSPVEQFAIQNMLEEIRVGNEAARRETRVTHAALTAAMVSNKSNILSSLVFEFPSILPFMFAGGWSPFSDLYDSELQDGYADELLEQIFVYSFVSGDKTLICFSWQNNPNAPGEIIAKQVQELPVDQQASACLQLTMKHIENVFFNPDWMRSLSAPERDKLDKLINSGVDLMGSVPSEPLQMEITYNLPEATRSFMV